MYFIVLFACYLDGSKLEDNMNLVKKLKRRKLKTRKCLNELRRRLLNESDNDFSKNKNSVYKIKDSEEYVNTKPNSMIMSNLSLRFLKKAVQSETVTRHSLQSIQNSALSKNDITIFSECKSSLKQPPITSDKSNNSLTKIITSRDNNYDFFYKAPPKSPSLFSSLKSDRTMISSIEGSASDSAEHLHVTSLKNLKNDSKGFGDSHFSKSSSEILVEENPTNYIKVGYIRDAAASQGDNLSTSTSGSSSLLCVRNTCPGSPVYLDDTPEYIYYPHRLNH
ncbi:PREDICTED: uncharacterized protein LOC106107707 [Papilio polytes]|uniref:uncharacterized protein LOC106107707 n=1 Tax=Papilio polytes TaxID=76194 RepID=UPI000675C67B|nr:PREDICTED: uncharacterized protein LOC106107707 [Papilio polytes]